MKRIVSLFAAGAIAACSLVSGAFAQTTPGAGPGLLAGSQIKDQTVKNLQDQTIGEIQELLVDPANGQLRFVVLSVGGFLGIGDTRATVPWNAFRVSRESGQPTFVLDASKERLEKAPKADAKNYDRLSTRETAEPFFIYWGLTWSGPPGASDKLTSSSTFSQP